MQLTASLRGLLSLSIMEVPFFFASFVDAQSFNVLLMYDHDSYIPTIQLLLWPKKNFEQLIYQKQSVLNFLQSVLNLLHMSVTDTLPQLCYFINLLPHTGLIYLYKWRKKTHFVYCHLQFFATSVYYIIQSNQAVNRIHWVRNE